MASLIVEGGGVGDKSSEGGRCAVTDSHSNIESADFIGLSGRTVVKVEDAAATDEAATDEAGKSMGMSRRRYVGPKDARERVQDWIKQKNEFRLFLVGKVGAGKSTLVNSLLKIDTEEEGAQVGSSLFPVTMAVKSYKGRVKRAMLPRLKLSIHDVNVQVWDTPGLQDPNEDRARECLEDVTETWRTKDISLIVYCVNMAQMRSDVGDKNAIRMLTEKLGDDVWSRSLFALTHANEVKVPLSAKQGETLESVYEKRLQEWDMVLKQYLRQANVESSIADKVPLVPCGYRENPLPVKPNSNWSAMFWEVCLVRMLFESIPALLSIHPSSIDGSLSDDYTRVIVQRLEEPKQEEADFINTLLEGSTAKDIAQYLSDTMLAKVRRRKAITASLLFLGVGATVFAVGMAK